MYYKNVTIINDTPRVVRMMIVSDAPSCGVTYNCHSDDSRGIIYAPRVINYYPREHRCQSWRSKYFYITGHWFFNISFHSFLGSFQAGDRHQRKEKKREKEEEKDPKISSFYFKEESCFFKLTRWKRICKNARPLLWSGTTLIKLFHPSVWLARVFSKGIPKTT